MEMDLRVIKYLIPVIPILAKMEQGAKKWKVVSTTASARQEPAVNTVKKRMLVSPILVQTMENACNLLMADIDARVKMDILV